MATNAQLGIINNPDGWRQSIMFKNLKNPRDLSKYTLLRGAPDFAQVGMWDEFESGYAYFSIVQIPKFLEILRNKDTTTYKPLIDTYLRVLEYEFKNLDGIENITSEMSEINTGHQTMQFISKVNKQSSSTFTLRYTEKSGAVLTRVHELYLNGIKDGVTEVKHYHGLLESGLIEEASYENETFSFMYFVTDNTFRFVQKAFYIVAAQPTTAALGELYNHDKSDISFKEVSCEFIGYPISNDAIDKKAQEMLNWLNDPTNPNRMIVNSTNFNYSGVSDITKYSITESMK